MTPRAGTAFPQVIRCSSRVSPKSDEGGVDFDCIFAADIISSGVSPQSGEGDIDFDCIFTGDSISSGWGSHRKHKRPFRRRVAKVTSTSTAFLQVIRGGWFRAYSPGMGI